MQAVVLARLDNERKVRQPWPQRLALGLGTRGAHRRHSAIGSARRFGVRRDLAHFPQVVLGLLIGQRRRSRALQVTSPVSQRSNTPSFDSKAALRSNRTLRARQ